MANPAIFFGDDPAMTSDVLQEDGGRGDVEDDNLPAADPVRDRHNSETAISMSLGEVMPCAKLGEKQTISIYIRLYYRNVIECPNGSVNGLSDDPIFHDGSICHPIHPMDQIVGLCSECCGHLGGPPTVLSRTLPLEVYPEIPMDATETPSCGNWSR